MVSLEDAKKKLDEFKVNLKTEKVKLSNGLGRILGQELRSVINMPPFDKSAMDGFAFHSDDLSEHFKIIEVLPAGIIPKKKIQKGTCSKIMTGAIVPEGANRIVKKEVTLEENGFMKITGEDRNQNICFKGEDIKKGDIVLSKGIKLRPAEIGILASMGLSEITVYKQPVIGVMATGSELIEPGTPLKTGQIYNSNSFSLEAQMMQMGLIVKNTGIVTDDKQKLYKALEEQVQSCSAVVLSGGVSAGDFDFIPEILEESGFTLHFQKIEVKPGKPTVFASRKDDVVFGTPGNPVSAFIMFEILIKPFLYKMMGHHFEPVIMKGTLSSRFFRKHADRTLFIPVYYENGEVKTLSYHGSAHLHALTGANGIICLSKGEREIPERSIVSVRSI